MYWQCIDNTGKISYNSIMDKFKYKIIKINGKKFIFKLDLNPITNDYDYHIYIRHLVTPEQAVSAFFTKTTDVYNAEYNRQELYSESLHIVVFYKELSPDILIITAFFEGGLND